jgi:deazaflavin-dependent oxidoreductase (nitroreductase family)
LTTRGRVTGREHEIEIWFVRHGLTLFMLAGAGARSDWVRNLRADPAVTVRVRDVTYSAHARVVEDPTEERLARDLVYAKYQTGSSGDLTGWRESALPVALDLRDVEGAPG